MEKILVKPRNKKSGNGETDDGDVEVEEVLNEPFEFFCSRLYSSPNFTMDGDRTSFYFLSLHCNCLWPVHFGFNLITFRTPFGICIRTRSALLNYQSVDHLLV